MYLGEARIYQDRINQFLDIAMDLQIEEFSQVTADEQAIGGDIDKTTAAYRTSPAGGRRLVSTFQLV